MGGRVRGGVLLGVDEAGRMSGAAATSRVRATAGAATAWGRALHAELVKVVTLPAMWWSAAVACGAAVATMMSVLRDAVDGRGLGFEEVAPVWALAVQIGFVAAGVATAGAEHSTAQGMTSLLVTPVRGRLAAARLMVLAGTGLVTASVLVGTSMAGCPTMSTAALWAGGRTVVWLTAVLLLSAGLAAQRHWCVDGGGGAGDSGTATGRVPGRRRPLAPGPGGPDLAGGRHIAGGRRLCRTHHPGLDGGRPDSRHRPAGAGGWMTIFHDKLLKRHPGDDICRNRRPQLPIDLDRPTPLGAHKISCP